MMQVNPYVAPADLAVQWEQAMVQVVRRDIFGFGSTTQIYQFACGLSQSRLLDGVSRFFEGNKATVVGRWADSLTMTRATTGWFRFVAVNERDITQQIVVRADNLPEGMVCQVEYTLENFFQLYLPPHNLEIEVRELARFAQSATLT